MIEGRIAPETEQPQDGPAPLQGFRYLSLGNWECQVLGYWISRTVYPSLPNPEAFSGLSVHVRYCRPGLDTDLWVQPYLGYTNRPGPENLERAVAAASAAIAQAALMLPPITLQEFLEAKAKDEARRKG